MASVQDKFKILYDKLLDLCSKLFDRSISLTALPLPRFFDVQTLKKHDKVDTYGVETHRWW